MEFLGLEKWLLIRSVLEAVDTFLLYMTVIKGGWLLYLSYICTLPWYLLSLGRVFSTLILIKPSRGRQQRH